MPYGVCGVAFGMSCAADSSSRAPIGAPVERKVCTRASAARSSGVSRSAVSTTFRTAAGERKTMLRVGLAHGRGDRGRGEGARGGDVHVGRHRAGAERRAQQRERREARHEPGVVRHVEVGGEHVAQRGELRVRVCDALRGSGRAGGEEDRGRVVGPGRRRERGVRHPIARMSPRLCDTPSAAAAGFGQPRGRDAHTRPAERARGGEPRRLADDEVRPRAADRAGQPADAEARVGDDDDGADPQARVDDR